MDISSQQPDNSAFQFDFSFTKTIPGLLKAGVILCCILGLICNNSYHGPGLAGFYNTVAIWAGMTSLFFWLLYSFRIPWRLRLFYWYLSELIHMALFCICFAICAVAILISAVSTGNALPKVFAALFGALAAGVLGYDAYFLKLKAYRRGEKGPGVVHQAGSTDGTGATVRKETVTTVTTVSEHY
jgi:hypothetical protein